MFTSCEVPALVHYSPRSGPVEHHKQQGSVHRSAGYPFAHWLCRAIGQLKNFVTGYSGHANPATAADIPNLTEPEFDFYHGVGISHRHCTSMAEFITTFIHPDGKNQDGTELAAEDAQSDAECIRLYNRIYGNHQKTTDSGLAAPLPRLNKWQSVFLGAMCCSGLLASAAPAQSADSCNIISMKFVFDAVPADHYVDATNADTMLGRSYYRRDKILMARGNFDSQTKEELMDQPNPALYPVPENSILAIEKAIPVIGVKSTLSLSRLVLLNGIDNLVPDSNINCQFIELYWDNGGEKISRANQVSTEFPERPVGGDQPRPGLSGPSGSSVCSLTLPHDEPGVHAYKAEILTDKSAGNINVKFKILIKPVNHLMFRLYTIGRMRDEITVRYYLHDDEHQNIKLNLIHLDPTCQLWKRVWVEWYSGVYNQTRQLISCSSHQPGDPSKKLQGTKIKPGPEDIPPKGYHNGCVVPVDNGPRPPDTNWKTLSLYIIPEANPQKNITLTLNYNALLSNGDDLDDQESDVCQKEKELLAREAARRKEELRDKGKLAARNQQGPNRSRSPFWNRLKKDEL